ncbi:DUF4145 domain-containing protein [Arundinibacter roseus]|uniref:DUF4145 domain-containing protein n=1 Tax=Arundinibacter roseus TaxID=2070510 RepID=A0A4R4KRP1_9BACT|nr:DUF4145 domain-containing protein [Arundinibacter roseus]TDB69101.1 DUF4145 domain-containing protein [Arundinibacter roseus]
MMENYSKVPNLDNVYFTEDALECPHCQTNMVPKFLFGYICPNSILEMNAENPLVLFVICTQKNCKASFLAEYKIEISSSGKIGPVKYFYSTSGVYYYSEYEEYPDEIEYYEKMIKKRPFYKSFIDIYKEAFTAESNSLGQIAGMGYRKAIEFLVKEYAMHLNSEKAETIASTALGTVINNYLSFDEELLNISKRASWLGNDEVHYLKKWIGKDINDLKKVILLTIQTIERVESIKDYINDMKDPR